MKSVRILMLATAAAALAAPSAHASGVVLKVKVPFDFVVADQQLPSGDYEIAQEHDGKLLRIYSKGSEQQAVAHCVPLAAGTGGSGTLVFHKHGKQHFLKMIRAGKGGGAYIPQTRGEHDARNGGDSATIGM